MEERAYQKYFTTQAIQRNTIVCAPTGSGKTYISLQVMHHFLTTYPDKKLLFLAPTQPLVRQQYRTVKEFLKAKINDRDVRCVCLHSGVAPRMSRRTEWKGLFECEVFVSTPEIIRLCLTRGYTSMMSFSLIVFDECHHAGRGEHPYALIMNDFYFRVSDNCRPHILGLTASPVDVNLVSKSQLNTLRQNIANLERALNSVVSYSDEVELEISKTISIPDLRRAYFINEIYHGQPVCCSLKYNSSELSKIKKKLVSDINGVLFELGMTITYFFVVVLCSQYYKKKDKSNVAKVKLDIADNILKSLEERESINKIVLTNKTKVLADILNKVSEDFTEFRVIVFVERRVITVALKCILERVLKHLNIDILCGHGNGNIGSMSAKKQEGIVKDFRSGKINVLLSTEVGYEGLDISSCNAVILYDLPKTLVGFLQSKGRARKNNAKVYFMIDKNDYSFEQKVASAVQNWEKILKAERGTVSNIDSSKYNDLIYKTPAGAFVTVNNSRLLLYQYCSSIPHDKYTDCSPVFETIESDGVFETTITLPILHSSINYETGIGESKRISEAIAALNVMKKLHKTGFIDNHLISNELPDIVSSDSHMKLMTDGKVMDYDMNGFGKLNSLSKTELFYVYRLLVRGKGLPIGLVTQTELDFADQFKFTAYLNENDYPECKIELYTALEINESQRHILKAFTKCLLTVPLTKIFNDNKTWYYFILFSDDNIFDLMKEMSTATTDVKNYGIAIGKRVVQEKSYDITRRRYKIVSGNKVNLMDPFPSDGYRTYRDYYEQRYDLVMEENEDLVEVEKINFEKNILQESPTWAYATSSRIHLVPSLIHYFPIPSDIQDCIPILPAFVHRIHQYALIQDFREKYMKDIDYNDIINAFTAKRAGDHFDYERLEFVGDAILKSVTSLYLFTAFPDYHEGRLSAIKCFIVSNMNLFECACKHGLTNFIFSESLHSLKTLPVFLANEKRDLSYKMIADVVESCIGCIYFNAEGTPTTRLSRIVEFLDKLGVLRYKHKAEETILTKLGEGSLNDLDNGCELKPSHLELIHDHSSKIEEIFNYTANNRLLLNQACIHPSMRLPNYERYEFLGDALLDFSEFRDIGPGVLSDLRSASVSNTAFAYFGYKLGLHELIVYSSDRLQADINDYISTVTEENFYELNPPKVLGDIVESVAGALFADMHYDMDKFLDVFLPVWKASFLQPYISPELVKPHPLRELIEDMQAKKLDFRFDLTVSPDETSCRLYIENVLFETGTGNSKGYAKKNLAIAALEKRDIQGGYIKENVVDEDDDSIIELDDSEEEEIFIPQEDHVCLLEDGQELKINDAEVIEQIKIIFQKQNNKPMYSTTIKQELCALFDSSFSLEYVNAVLKVMEQDNITSLSEASKWTLSQK